jgi:hypothetical protein
LASIRTAGDATHSHESKPVVADQSLVSRALAPMDTIDIPVALISKATRTFMG